MNTPLRIGIEAQRIFRAHKHGMDIYALELIKALQKIDTTNQYFVFAQPGDDESCLQETANFKIITHRTFSYPLWEQWTLPKLVKKYNLDLLHCTANTAPLFLECKKIVTLHDIIFLESNPMNKGSWYQKFGNLYRRWIVPAMVKKCETLITVSHFERKRIQEYFGFSDEKVQAIYNGVGNHFFEEYSHNQLEAVKKKYALPDNYILFLGNKNPKKNLPNVIRAYDKCLKANKDVWKMAILDFDQPSLKTLIEQENLSPQLMDKIVFPGYVPNLQLPLLIQASRLFLYPSLRESFGIPIIEAMACGVPVITSNTSSMPEVGGEAALLINPTNVSELADAMNQLMNNPLLADNLKAAGKRRATHFSWQDTALQTLALYETNLNRIPTISSFSYATA